MVIIIIIIIITIIMPLCVCDRDTKIKSLGDHPKRCVSEESLSAHLENIRFKVCHSCLRLIFFYPNQEAVHI
jgi:hypothetical protein